MTVGEIIVRANALIEETYANAIWYGWVDTVLEELTPLAKVLTTTTVAITLADYAGDVTISTSLPTLFEIVSVSYKPTGGRERPLRYLSHNDHVSTGWTRLGNTIHLQGILWGAGSAVIRYYTDLARTVSGTDFTINLPTDYHDIVVKGICALAMQKEEEFDRKQDFYGEYTLGKHRMLAERILAVEPWNAHLVRGGGNK